MLAGGVSRGKEELVDSGHVVAVPGESLLLRLILCIDVAQLLLLMLMLLVVMTMAAAAAGTTTTATATVELL